MSIASIGSGGCYPTIQRLLCDPSLMLENDGPPEDFWPDVDDSIYADDFVVRLRSTQDPDPGGPPGGIDVNAPGDIIGEPPPRRPMPVDGDAPADDILDPPAPPPPPPGGDPKAPGGDPDLPNDPPTTSPASPISIGID